MDRWWESCWTLLYYSNCWLANSAVQVLFLPLEKLETVNVPIPSFAKKWSLDATEAAVAAGRRRCCRLETDLEGMTGILPSLQCFISGPGGAKIVLS